MASGSFDLADSIFKAYNLQMTFIWSCTVVITGTGISSTTFQAQLKVVAAIPFTASCWLTGTQDSYTASS